MVPLVDSIPLAHNRLEDNSMQIAKSTNKAMITKWASDAYQELTLRGDDDNALRIVLCLRNIRDFAVSGDIDSIVEAIDNFLNS